MARDDLKELYRQLMAGKFVFLKGGEHQLQDIYRSVKANFPSLCDDNYWCSENCSQGNDQPEWLHTVRKALATLKRYGDVENGSRRGFWIFR